MVASLLLPNSDSAATNSTAAATVVIATIFTTAMYTAAFTVIRISGLFFRSAIAAFYGTEIAEAIGVCETDSKE